MKTLKLLSLLMAAAFLFGCASAAKMENMASVGEVGETRSYDPALQNEVKVTAVSGGESTNPLWTSEISNESFAGAVRSSLAAHDLLAEEGKYQLHVKLLRVAQPLFGLDMTVTSHVKYVLIDSSSGAAILDETVVAPHTATVGDAFVAVKRLRLANEGSGRKNIEGLLDKLAALKIRPQQISVAE